MRDFTNSELSDMHLMVTLDSSTPDNDNTRHASISCRHLEHHKGDSTFSLCPTPNFEGKEGQRSPIFLPLPFTSQEDLQLNEYLECHTDIHLQTSMPSLGFEPRFYDTAISV
ncbi:hypothetical protein TNCV_3810401 [Trichonephila clavipes]|nr:hypothetical protein TNCV_3810401 [Trichonephila clavipes]